MTERRKLDEGGMDALGVWEQGHPSIKSEERSLVPSRRVTTDSAQALREEDERLRVRGVLKKIASLDPVEEISCADKARLTVGLRQ